MDMTFEQIFGLLLLIVFGPICVYAWYTLEKAKQAPGNETGGSTEDSADGSGEYKKGQAENDLYLDMQWWSH